MKPLSWRFKKCKPPHGVRRLVPGTTYPELPKGRAVSLTARACYAEIASRHWGDGVPEPRILAYGMPSWRVAAERAAKLAQALSPATLEHIVAEACEIAREPRVDDVARVFTARCAVAMDLTHRTLDIVEQRQ
jgi:hypothetical protein